MRKVIFWFDRWLSNQYGIYSVQDAEDCLLRVQITQARHPVGLVDLSLKAGEPILALHLWNDHLPQLPPDGPDMAWARSVQRLFIVSLQAVAREMQSDPRLADLGAVQGETVLISMTGGDHLIRRLGFVILPAHNPLGRFGEFWENFYTWGLMWAYNPVSLRNRHFSSLKREEMWMAADQFIRRFGSAAEAKSFVERDRIEAY